MKIDLITLHRVRNYGSSLQTVATQMFFEKNDIDVEVIDYYPERYTSFGLLKRLKYKSDKLKKNPILLLAARMIISVSYIKKKIIFDAFLKRKIKLTDKTYKTEEELKEADLKADAFCTGSDQVWNSHWNEGVDRPFYLSFIGADAYKFSYAASIGNTELGAEEADEVEPMLNQYRHITVRENAGVDVIKQLGLSASQMLDPTLLFNEKDWTPFISEKFKNKKYVLTYNLHHDKRIDEYAFSLAKKHNLEVYNISYNFHDIIRKGKLKWCPSIEEYLGLIHDAEFVVTDSFHATVFSILFKKKFIDIFPEEASSRLRSILALTELESRGFDDMPGLEDAEAEPDFKRAEIALERERERASDYLEMIKKEINSEAK